MEQLVYESQASSGFDPGDMFDIVQGASRRNKERGITGFLLFRAGRFLQLLEAPSDVLETMLEDLERDERHSNLRIFARRQIPERHFGDWSMKRVHSGTDTDQLALIKQSLASLGGGTRLFEEFLDDAVSQAPEIPSDTDGHTA
jgi:hypothetical protein